jgi:hypothetical protein
MNERTEHTSSSSTLEEREPTLWPFQKAVVQRISRCDCDVSRGSCRCYEGIKTRLPKSTTYHNLRKVDRWTAARAARVAFSRRLMTMGVPRAKAEELSWRLLEEMLFYSETATGFDLVVLDIEIDAMLAYGQEREYPESPTDEQIAEAMRDRDIVFAKESTDRRRPTTVMHLYKRLGLWDLARRILEHVDPERGEFENYSNSSTWKSLGVDLQVAPTLAEIRNGLRQYIRTYVNGAGDGQRAE